MKEGSGIAYFHISPNDLGDTVTLDPRDPTGFGLDEPTDPRICVSSTVEGCLVAVTDAIADDEFIYIYKAQGSPEVVKPHGVADALVTGEQWLTSPTTFKKIATMPTSAIPRDLWEEFMNVSTMGTPSDLIKQEDVKQKLKPIIDKYIKNK